MIVAFDAICLADGPATGVARAFLTGLAAYAEAYPQDVLVLAPAAADRSALAGLRIVDAPRGALRRQFALPGLLRTHAVTVLHSPVAAVPLRAPCPTIATVHDLPWLQPESGERATRRQRFATTRALRAATAVIAPSRYTLAAAARLLGGADKLHHVPHATPPVPPSPPLPRDGPLLVLGDDRPRKNHDRVRAAHALARQRDPSLPDLRFVGPHADYVDEDEKRRLLRTCRAVVACSLYEGYGLPVLEALAHGAPLVCSDLPPHREIAGAAALFVDPTDVAAIADALLAAARLDAPPAPPRLPTPRDVADAWRRLHDALA
ncbi:MAG: glycosyltransferase [Planctomycetota bacterium]